MGIDWGIVNHTKKEYMLFDRRFHDFTAEHGEFIAKHWRGDHLEVGHDCGGLLSDLYEGPGGKGSYKLVGP